MFLVADGSAVAVRFLPDDQPIFFSALIIRYFSRVITARLLSSHCTVARLPDRIITISLKTIFHWTHLPLPPSPPTPRSSENGSQSKCNAGCNDASSEDWQMWCKATFQQALSINMLALTWPKFVDDRYSILLSSSHRC